MGTVNYRKYPFNLYKDMMRFNPVMSKKIEEYEDCDFLDKVYSCKYILSEEEYQVLCKSFKEYKTELGIAIDMDKPDDDVHEWLMTGVSTLAEWFPRLIATNFGEKYERDMQVEYLIAGIKDLDVLKAEGVITIGDLRDVIFGDKEVEVPFLDEEKERLEKLLAKVPRKSAGRLVVVRREGMTVYGVCDAENKAPYLVTGYLGDIRKLYSPIVWCLNGEPVHQDNEKLPPSAKKKVAVKKKEPAVSSTAEGLEIKTDTSGQISFIPSAGEASGSNKITEKQESKKPVAKEVVPTSDNQEKSIINLDTPIAWLYSGRKKVALESVGIRKLGDLATVSLKDLAGLKGIGSSTLSKLTGMFTSAGGVFVNTVKKEESVAEVKPAAEAKKATQKLVKKLGGMPSVASDVGRSRIPASKIAEVIDVNNERLPDRFLMYIRGTDNHLATMSITDIFGAYKDYLDVEKDVKALEAFDEALKMLGEDATTNIITVFENHRESTVFDREHLSMREYPNENVCFRSYVKVLADKYVTSIKNRMLYKTFVNRSLSEGYSLSLIDALDYINLFEVNIDVDVAFRLYKYVYVNDPVVAKSVFTKPKAKGKYVGSKKFLVPKMQEYGVPESISNEIDIFCEDRDVHYSWLFDNLKKMKSHFGDKNICRVIELLLKWFNGQYGIFSVIQEKYPKYCDEI